MKPIWPSMLMIAVAGTMLGAAIASAYWEGRFDALTTASLSRDIGSSNGDLSACGAMLDYLDVGAPVRGEIIWECFAVPPTTAKAKKQLDHFALNMSPQEIEIWNALRGVACIGRNELGECNFFQAPTIFIDDLSAESE